MPDYNTTLWTDLNCLVYPVTGHILKPVFKFVATGQASIAVPVCKDGSTVKSKDQTTYLNAKPVQTRIVGLADRTVANCNFICNQIPSRTTIMMIIL